MADDNNYVVGRGRLYFDRFLPNTKTKTGERYFGNTPDLSLSNQSETLDHFSSESGLKVKDASVTLSNNQSGKFSTDNINAENVALLFLGDASTLTIASATAVVDTFNDVILGTYLQAGTSAAVPDGARNISNVVVKKGATTIPLLNNYEVDLELGRVHILSTAVGITAGDDLTVTYDVAAGTRDVVISKNTTIYGAMRFIADNPVGENKDYFWPYVKIQPDGDFALKGDTWQQASFSFDVLQLDDDTERAYIAKR